MTLVRFLARPLLATTFISGGMNALKNADQVAAKAEPVTEKLAPAVDKATGRLPIPVNDKTLVQANALVQIVAGGMLATGRAPRLSSLALAATLVPTTLAGHRYWEETDPAVKANQRIHFYKNVSMLGGLMLASVDTEGKPGVAWRAKHQAKHAKDKALQLAPG